MADLGRAAKSALRTAMGSYSTAQEVINILNAVDLLSATEAGYLDSVTAGTFVASKAMVLDSSGNGKMPDSGIFKLGTDGDIAVVLRATTLNANTALTGVLVGTPVTPAVAANSMILSNVTADGDLLLATQTGGNSQAAMFVDASAGTTYFYGAGTQTLSTTASTVTVATSKTLAVTTADLLTVGGTIVPQAEVLVSFVVDPHASKVVYNLFVARDAWQVTHIDYTPDIAQGGALTATVVKAVGTATPASGTTPMHTANAVDCNAVAHTVQPITLTATTADLQLAAGNRIGLVLSGALTTGSGLLTIRGKRI